MAQQLKLRYKGGNGQVVTGYLGGTWKREDVPRQIVGSSGPKDLLRNDAWLVFDADPAIESVSTVMARGVLFFIMRRNGKYFDVRHVEHAKKGEPAWQFREIEVRTTTGGDK